MKAIIFSVLAVVSGTVLAETKVTFKSSSECVSVWEEVRNQYTMYRDPKSNRYQLGMYSGNGKVIRIGCYDPLDGKSTGGGELIVRTVQEEADFQIKIENELRKERIVRQQQANTILKSVGL